MYKILFHLFMALCILALAALTVVLTGCTPEQNASAAAKIADFNVPAGFAPEFAVEVHGYVAVSYKGPGGPSHLYLIQTDNEADGEELENMLAQLAPGASDPQTRMTVIENRNATVRGQQVTVVISAGLNSDQVQYREATVVFHGKGGPALLVFSDSAERWSQEALDTLLGSIQ